MTNNVHGIKNPLTVISVFAALSEAFACYALPKLAPNMQIIFVWFVIGFPLVLILLFFATLNWNHKALYAPSDYKSDDTFLKTFELRAAEIENELIKRTSEVFGELVTLILTDLSGRVWQPASARFNNERTRLDARNKIVDLMRSSEVDADIIAGIAERYNSLILKNIKDTFSGFLNSYVRDYAINYSRKTVEIKKPDGTVVTTTKYDNPDKRMMLEKRASSEEVKSLVETFEYDVNRIEKWLRDNELYGGDDVPKLLKEFSELKTHIEKNGLLIK